MDIYVVDTAEPCKEYSWIAGVFLNEADADRFMEALKVLEGKPLEKTVESLKDTYESTKNHTTQNETTH